MALVPPSDPWVCGLWIVLHGLDTARNRCAWMRMRGAFRGHQLRTYCTAWYPGLHLEKLLTFQDVVPRKLTRIEEDVNVLQSYEHIIRDEDHTYSASLFVYSSSVTRHHSLGIVVYILAWSVISEQEFPGAYHYYSLLHCSVYSKSPPLLLCTQTSLGRCACSYIEYIYYYCCRRTEELMPSTPVQQGTV